MFPTWFHYILVVAVTHVPIHGILALIGVAVDADRRLKLASHAVFLSMASGACFGVAFVLPPWSEAIAEFQAWVLAVAAGVAAIVARKLALHRSPSLMNQSQDMDMVVISTLGAFLILLAKLWCPLGLGAASNEDAGLMLWIIGPSLYWSPAILIPRRVSMGGFHFMFPGSYW